MAEQTPSRQVLGFGLFDPEVFAQTFPSHLIGGLVLQDGMLVLSLSDVEPGMENALASLLAVAVTVCRHLEQIGGNQLLASYADGLVVHHSAANHDGLARLTELLRDQPLHASADDPGRTALAEAGVGADESVVNALARRLRHQPASEGVRTAAATNRFLGAIATIAGVDEQEGVP